MADVFRRLIGDLPGAFGSLDRLGIRRSIGAALGADVSELSHRPRVDGWFISVSHTAGFGGWVAAREPVGFDVERLARLRPELIARVSRADERAAAPDARWLWAAKEAAFKAMVPQPATLPEVVITSWDGCAFSTAHGGGLVAVDGDLVFGLFKGKRPSSSDPNS